MSDRFTLFDNEEVKAEKFDKVYKDGASNLSNFIRESINIDNDIKDLELVLKNKKLRRRKIHEEDIPNLMQEMGMTSVNVEGHKVKLQNFYHARISEENKDKAFSWLRSIGEGDLIKNDVVVSFSQGQDNQAGVVIDGLRNQGLEPTQKTHVHPQTLKAWVKGRVESGQPLDFDVFGVFTGTEAKITKE